MFRLFKFSLISLGSLYLVSWLLATGRTTISGFSPVFSFSTASLITDGLLLCYFSLFYDPASSYVFDSNY